MDWWSMLIGAGAFYALDFEMKISRLKRRVEALEAELLEYPQPSTAYARKTP